MASISLLVRPLAIRETWSRERVDGALDDLERHRPEETTSTTFWSLILGIGIVVLALMVFSIAWIFYNLRLAARGRRNRQTRYEAGVIDRDKLDRPITMADVHELRDAAIVVIHTDAEEKRYEVGANRGNH